MTYALRITYYVLRITYYELHLIINRIINDSSAKVTRHNLGRVPGIVYHLRRELHVASAAMAAGLHDNHRIITFVVQNPRIFLQQISVAG